MMFVVEQLIHYQHEKSEFLRAYLAANDMLEARASEQNFLAMKELMEKKQGLAAAIDVVDDKIVAGIARLKEVCEVRDLAAIDVNQFPELKTLKLEAATVLKLMVELKHSDQAVSGLIDQAFETLKHSVRHIDKNKLYYYTHQYFDQSTNT